MRWRISFLFMASLFFSMAKAQPIGAPPVFTGSNVLQNTEGLKAIAGKVETISDSNAHLRILHLGDSHVKSGFFSEAFVDSLNSFFSQALNKPDFLRLTVMAKNGATSKHFLEDVYNAEEVQNMHPDIIIVSLGTNEAQNLYSQNDLQLYFTQLLTQIKKDAPDAALVFTTPGDAFRKTTRTIKKKKRYYTVTGFTANNTLTSVVGFIKDFAEKNGAAYWDWYAVMGGRGAIARWVGHGYANMDRIHLLEKGYNLQAWLLASAFIKYFKL